MKEPNVVMTAPGRALKRLTRLRRQQKLLTKYRKRAKKLKSRIDRQRYFLLLGRMERLEIAWHNCPKKAIEEALSRLHARMLACRIRRRQRRAIINST